MQAQADLTLSVPARSENLAPVRQAVAQFAESLGAEPDVIEDVRLAVNEACSNVVRHAYGNEDGDLEVAARPDGRRLLVQVRDSGRGFSAPTDNPGAGAGLTLMRAASEALRIAERANGSGTHVWLAFPLQRTG